jgi:hypothetical protein
LQPYEGTVLAEVVDYLNSLERDEVSRKIADALIMCFLPLARQERGEELEREALRMTCLEACDALSKHASYLRQALKVSQPQFEMPYPIAPSLLPSPSIQGTVSSSQVNSPDPPTENKPSPSIQGKGSAADVDAIFGDDD